MSGIQEWLRDSRIPSREYGRAIALALLLSIAMLDGVSDIPPLGDDLWMLQQSFGNLTRDYAAAFGWMARPLGMGVLDVAFALARPTDTRVLLVVLGARAITLFGLYVVSRRYIGLGASASLALIALFAFTAPAFETWTMVVTIHEELSVIPLAACCGLYGRAVAHDADLGASWKFLAGAAVGQMATYALYELTLAAIPAFIVVLAAFAARTRRYRRSSILAASVAIGVAAFWSIGLLVTGYVENRLDLFAFDTPRGEVGVHDLVDSARVTWIAFVQHHLWRVIEILRRGTVFWWDATAAGVIAFVATVGATLVVATALLSRSVYERSTRHAESAGLTAMSVGTIALASSVATVASVLPYAVAYVGFPIVSRVFYYGGFFVALGIAFAVDQRTGRAGLLLRALVLAFLAWSAVVTRRYLEDMRGGARIVRATARAIAALPPAYRSDRILVIAPAVVGTFSTSSVETFALRGAIARFGGTEDVGPLYFARRCPPGLEPIIVDGEPADLLAPVSPERLPTDDTRDDGWAAVVRAVDATIKVGSSVADVCGGNGEG